MKLNSVIPEFWNPRLILVSLASYSYLIESSLSKSNIQILNTFQEKEGDESRLKETISQQDAHISSLSKNIEIKEDKIAHLVKVSKEESKMILKMLKWVEQKGHIG